ncbi:MULTISPECIES: hypothetical protein [Paenibacillus]|nr:hypothetical protein [Paenibacillus lautus]
MKIEVEVNAFGKDEVQGTIDSFKKSEIVRVYELSKDTTLRGRI